MSNDTPRIDNIEDRVETLEDQLQTSETASLATGNTYLVPHGLGSIPTHIMPSLVFQNAVSGWSIGDEIFRWVDGLTGIADSTIAVAADNTNIIVRVNNSQMAHFDKNTGANISLPVTNLKMKLKFY